MTLAHSAAAMNAKPSKLAPAPRVEYNVRGDSSPSSVIGRMS
ncbi:hypothetical protein [Rhodococcus opacus]|nr:hypothetical protein [Rhodococcus opacus]